MVAVAALILTGGGFGYWWTTRQQEGRPLEEMLWVCDWEMREFHGPGTTGQSTVVHLLRERGMGDAKFTAPVLYRMGGSATGRGNEGILMQPFDPRNPEAARVMITEE